MAKCPKCETEIDYLNNYQSGENKYELNILPNGDWQYEEIDFLPNDATNDYECPVCSEVIFTDQDKAINFLKGIKIEV